MEFLLGNMFPVLFKNPENTIVEYVGSVELFLLGCYLILAQVESRKPRSTPTRVLLPHEIVHALEQASSPMVWESIMLGGFDDQTRVLFWEHIKGLPPWKNHPVFKSDAPLERVIGLTFHGDGAVMKRDDECFVWSVSSVFSFAGPIKEILMIKWPICIIPERFMRSHSAIWLSLENCLMCIMFLGGIFGGKMCKPWYGLLSFLCLISEVQDAVNKEIARLVAWSLLWSAKGVAPEKGFYMEEFAKGTYRFNMAGKELANGWRTLCSKQVFFLKG